ncbi:MAG: hypothetical protein LQ342_005414 [Letrouitia transgressa]|nr:MAG: hypothetical protein LQ342_005414 [Letrouitia transgressa]
MSDRSSKNKRASHGRGGAGERRPRALGRKRLIPSAGNIGPTTNSAKSNLVTPTIKQDVYTTGRGGSGNMMKNDPQRPEIARKSQDVGPTPRRNSEGATHTGRGGAANIIRPTPEEIKNAKRSNAIIEHNAFLDEDMAPQDPSKEGDWWRDALMDGRERVETRNFA